MAVVSKWFTGRFQDRMFNEAADQITVAAGMQGYEIAWDTMELSTEREESHTYSGGYSVYAIHTIEVLGVKEE